MDLQGYLEDGFDRVALREELIVLFVAGSSEVVTAIFDPLRDEAARTTSPVGRRPCCSSKGVFLQCPNVLDQWDLVIYLDAPDDEVLRRAVTRDVEGTRSADEVRRRYVSRYLPAQALHHSRCSPVERADVVVDNVDPGAPQLLRWCSALEADYARAAQGWVVDPTAAAWNAVVGDGLN